GGELIEVRGAAQRGSNGPEERTGAFGSDVPNFLRREFLRLQFPLVTQLADRRIGRAKSIAEAAGRLSRIYKDDKPLETPGQPHSPGLVHPGAQLADRDRASVLVLFAVEVVEPVTHRYRMLLRDVGQP